MAVFRIVLGLLRRDSGRRGMSRAVSLAAMFAGALAVLGACASPSGYRGGPASGSHVSNPATPYAIVVQSGESLSVLAERHNVPMRALARAHHISAPKTINTGPRRIVPAPRTHLVQRGDTLSEIALTHDTTTREVASLNGKRAPYPIYVGEVLRVGGWTPDGGRGDARRQAAPTRTASVRPAPRPATGAPSPRAKPSLPSPPARSGRFLWPAEGRIISSFGPKQGGLHNDGINIRVPRGTPVVAADNGVVAYAGNELKGYGNLVLVRHQDGYVTAYAHNSELLVSRGDVVTKGKQIARSGASGGVSEPQIHFEVRRGAKAVDPMTYLGNNVASR